MNRHAGGGGVGVRGTTEESLGDFQGLKRPLGTRPYPGHRGTVSEQDRSLRFVELMTEAMTSA